MQIYTSDDKKFYPKSLSLSSKEYLEGWRSKLSLWKYRNKMKQYRIKEN